MSDQTVTLDNDQWSNRELTEAQQKNRASAALIPFGETGVSPQSFAQAVDFAKMMSTARGAVPKHLIGNTGACLAVIELGQKFQMSAYMLAMGCFSVNDMLAFTGQTIMAIMNKHMPLAPDEHGNKTRLQYRFEGEHAEWKMEEVEETDRFDNKTGKKIWINRLIKPSSRKIIVSGRMAGEANVLEYESPIVANIKNKNSPLWEEDEDQQLIYWASRRWQRRWWPEGMLGIYSDDELANRNFGADHAKVISNDDEPGKRLLERLAQAKADAVTDVAPREGFTVEHAHNETTAASSPASGEPGQSADQSSVADAPAVDTDPEHIVLPRNAAEWRVHTLAWIEQAKTDPKITYEDMVKKWKEETGLRNDCGMSAAPNVATRDEVYDAFMEVRDNKPKNETQKAATKAKKK